MESITTLEEFNKILSENTNVFLKFSAEWCGPCRALAPKVKKFSEKYENVKFLEADADSSKELVTNFKISALPTIIIFHKEKLTARIEGANVRDIQEALEDLK